MPSNNHLGTQKAPFTRETSGDITGDAETLILYAPNSASAIITVEGTFEGTLTITGAATDGGLEGGRILFRDGFGSLGQNTIVDGVGAVPREYRIVCGGDYIIIRGSAWVIGSATVRIYTQETHNMLFINGPVHDAKAEAVRAERGFISSTGPQSVPIGNVLVATLQNPIGSGVNLFLTDRLFGNDNNPTDLNLEYISYITPTYTPTTANNGFNRKSGFPLSISDFAYEVRSIDGLAMGGSQSTGAILPNGLVYELLFDFIMPPGIGLGFVISGAGANVAQAVRTSIGFTWYEEAI